LKGLSAGLATAADYADWWLFRLDQLRRSVDWSLEKDDLLVDQQALALRREMANASSYMDACSFTTFYIILFFTLNSRLCRFGTRKLHQRILR
jgi:hypothetical protein